MLWERTRTSPTNLTRGQDMCMCACSSPLLQVGPCNSNGPNCVNGVDTAIDPATGAFVTTGGVSVNAFDDVRAKWVSFGVTREGSAGLCTCASCAAVHFCAPLCTNSPSLVPFRSWIPFLSPFLHHIP